MMTFIITHCFSIQSAVKYSCTMIGWNFTELAMMGYDEAKDFVVKTKPKPEPIPCAEVSFDEDKSPYSSVVQEVSSSCNLSGIPVIYGDLKYQVRVVHTAYYEEFKNWRSNCKFNKLQYISFKFTLLNIVRWI